MIEKQGDPKEERGSPRALQEDIGFGVLKEEKKTHFFQHWFVLVNRTVYLAYLKMFIMAVIVVRSFYC